MILPTMFPVGLEAIKKEYGDPSRFMIGSRVSPEWPDSILTKVRLPAPLPLAWDKTRTVQTISCHVLIACSLGSILGAIEDAGLWPEIRSYGGCYCWRTMRGASRLSAHAWAIAIDIDCADERNRLGSKPVIHPAIVEAFELAGWTSGANWKTPDGMHQQACGGY
jgi:hypothetical protein